MKILTIPLAVTALTLAGCSTDSSTPESSQEDPKKTETAAELKDGDMIGLTIEAAEALAGERGLKARTVSVDGEVRPVTMDYLPDRVNFTVEQGNVTKVTRG
ncbi:MAG: hypothetical protein P1U81_12655 [Verrucomicrobiales bacterium]|jgi:uncharacterized protein YceK|nr:hypothetical protein [Verrucomicrobiales bacterium]